ncbi:alpha/beta-hydrolase [Mycena alexandri]|uniref:Alpha/beta-hydrolase n=1 Tax=Mycena alexandri TaxID=1745969 RepID=A0AAD6S683_9AGAR|nr:alpha/beta-hydrolase [Mycena alexandri]
MERSRYKQVKTKRGFNYSYYFSPPATSKPVLFFAHGFPGGSSFWRRQVAFFEPLGYGLLVPDLLGYGGTDKPTDPKLYVGSGHANDFLDIFEAEGLEQVIAIGHDWGSFAVSRLVNHHPQRVSACGFLAGGYFPPVVQNADLITRSPEASEIFGYDIFVFMRFFVQPDPATLIEKHIDSFIGLFFPESPHSWTDHLCVDGGTQAWLEGNKTAGLPSYMTEEDKQLLKDSLLNGGLSGPLCWFRLQIDEANAEDDATISSTAREVVQPLLFIPFTEDLIAPPVFGDTAMDRFAKGPVTREEVGGDHWAVQSHALEVNDTILRWIQGLSVADLGRPEETT